MGKPVKKMARLLQLLCVIALASADDLEYIRANAAKDGTVRLPSGLQYRPLVHGSIDNPRPGLTTQCAVHYSGSLTTGKVFDSSYNSLWGFPAMFAPSGVIKGWTEAMQLMREGDKWELVVPSSLAYGERGAGGSIGPRVRACSSHMH